MKWAVTHCSWSALGSIFKSLENHTLGVRDRFYSRILSQILLYFSIMSDNSDNADGSRVPKGKEPTTKDRKRRRTTSSTSSEEGGRRCRPTARVRPLSPSPVSFSLSSLCFSCFRISFV